MSRRQCGFCGKYVPGESVLCPFCRETLPPVPVIHSAEPGTGRIYIRRGLLYMLMAAVIHYFASASGPLELPFEVPPFVGQYLVPFLFLSGLGLMLYGLYRHFAK